MLPKALSSFRRGLSAAIERSRLSIVSTLLPGSRLAETETGSLRSSRARHQKREASRTAGPLAPKWVHRSEPSTRAGASSDAHRELRRLRHPGKIPVKIAVENERHEGRRRGDERMAQASRDLEPESVASRLGKREPARRQNHSFRAESLLGVVNEKPASARCTESTRWPRRTSTPRRSASPTSASRTLRARFESGKSFPCSSSWRATPSSSKNSIVCSTRKARSTRLTKRELPPRPLCPHARYGSPPRSRPGSSRCSARRRSRGSSRRAFGRSRGPESSAPAGDEPRKWRSRARPRRPRRR